MKVIGKRHRITGTQATGLQRIFYPTGFKNPIAAIIIGASVSPSYQIGFAATANYADNNLFICFVGPNAIGQTTRAASQVIYSRNAQTNSVTRNGTTFYGMSTLYFNNTTYVTERVGFGFTFRSDCLEYTFTQTPATPTDDIETLCIFFGGNGLSAGVGTALQRTSANQGVGITFGFQPELLIGFEAGSGGTLSSGSRANHLSFGITQRLPSVKSVYSVYSSNANVAVGASVRSGIGTDLWLKQPVFTQTTTANGGAGGAVTTISGFGVSVWTRNATASNFIFCYMGLKFNENYDSNYFYTPTGTGTTFINLGFVPQFIMGSSVGATQLQITPGSGVGGTQASADSISYWYVNGPSDLGKFEQGQGTLTTTNGSTTITGTATSFFGQVSEGYVFYDSNYNFVGVVSSLTSNTAGLFKTAATTTLTTDTYFFRDYGQSLVWYGANANISPSQLLGGSGYTAFQYWDIRSATSSTATVSGSVITLDGSPGFTISYNNVSTVPTLNWYLAFGAEQREKRRATG